MNHIPRVQSADWWGRYRILEKIEQEWNIVWAPSRELIGVNDIESKLIAQYTSKFECKIQIMRKKWWEMKKTSYGLTRSRGKASWELSSYVIWSETETHLNPIRNKFYNFIFFSLIPHERKIFSFSYMPLKRNFKNKRKW